jgi:hypothetical protein
MDQPISHRCHFACVGDVQVLPPFQRASLNIGTTKITETSAIQFILFGVIAQKQDQNRHRTTAKP